MHNSSRNDHRFTYQQEWSSIARSADVARSLPIQLIELHNLWCKDQKVPTGPFIIKLTVDNDFQEIDLILLNVPEDNTCSHLVLRRRHLSSTWEDDVYNSCIGCCSLIFRRSNSAKCCSPKWDVPEVENLHHAGVSVVQALCCGL